MIKLDSVTKKFGDFTAVDNVSYSIQKGESFALLGPNGAGKTTIVRMLLNFTTPSAGSVTIDGRSASDPESYEKIFTALSAMAGLEHFESAKGALLAFAALYESHYEDAEKREQLRAAIDAHRTNMPLFLQIEVLTSLAQTAYDQGDPATCNEIIHQADELLEEARFFPRMYFPMKARIIALIHLSGEPDRANESLDALIQKYDSVRDDIIDIYRCAMVCRIAEASVATGRSQQAIDFYLRAAAESTVNPNSRPRADDLNEICCSVALSGIAPSTDLLLKLNTINDELGDPW